MSDAVYLPPSGRGPAVLMISPQPSRSVEEQAEYLASDGYVVQTAALTDGPSAAAALKQLSDHPGRVGKIAAIAHGEASDAGLDLAKQEAIAALALYDPPGDSERLGATPCPAIVHLGSGNKPCGPPRRPTAEPSAGIQIFTYRDAAPGFFDSESAAWNPYAAGIAYSRTLALLRRELGPRYNLSDLWDYHAACEFELKDPTENMTTMVAEPYVNHVPTMTGGVGHDLLKRFYTYHFIGRGPSDRRTIPISRTIGPDRLVEEKVFCFTHDAEIDWMLPGVKPTGKRVEIPIVVVITFRGDKLYNEHIYWDQASVLAQLGLLDPTGLPIAGVDQARKLLDKTRPSNTLMATWKSSEGKPI